MRSEPLTIRWKLIAGSLLAIGIPLLAFAFLLSRLLWGFYVDQLREELNAKAYVVAEAVAPILAPDTPDDPEELTRMVDLWRRYSQMRVTVIDSQAVVRAATTTEDVGQTISEERRPGMLLALQGEANDTQWRSPNFGYEDTLYVNVPVQHRERLVGAVRVAYSLTQIQQNIGRIQAALLAAGAAYAALIIALTFGLAGSIARPVEALNRSAERFAAGDLDHRAEVGGTREVVALGQTLNQMAARLHQLEGLRRQYVSNVSHELRTPLAAIRGMAETLLTHGETDPDLRGRYLPRIVSQTDRLARLASQLLDLAQIESGNLLHRLEPVSVASVLDEVLSTCHEGAEQRGVRLVTDVPESLPLVPMDRDRMVQVLLNLVDNALRYTPMGGSVSVAARHGGGELAVSVRDTGKGIPPEHLPHLFERFYRVDPARTSRAGGTGLGLAIVKQIVEAHEGRIDVESTPGVGTTFTVTLPAGAAEPAREEGELAGVS
jgi:signal transduction histidine kinase